MWYMYMMIGVYFLAPFIVLVKINIPDKDFEKIACIFTIWASLSSWTSNYLLQWDLGKAFLYMGYFMLGYIIRNRTRSKHNNLLGVCFILSGIMLELVIAYIQYLHILQGIAENDEKYALILPQTPWIVCASVVIFYGFSLLDIKWNFGKLSSYAFYIYLFHAGVWDIIRRVIKLYGMRIINSNIAIPFGVILVFLISYILSRCYVAAFFILLKKKLIK